MKIYTIYGESYDKVPNPLTLPDGSQISPVSEAKFIELGGTIEDDGKPTHMEELDDACDKFIANVLDIQEFIGSTDFFGGIDEMDTLDKSEAAAQNPTQALTLAQRWSATDRRCNFFADKPDLIATMHSPNWFYYAWARYAQQVAGGK